MTCPINALLFPSVASALAGTSLTPYYMTCVDKVLFSSPSTLSHPVFSILHYYITNNKKEKEEEKNISYMRIVMVVPVGVFFSLLTLAHGRGEEVKEGLLRRVWGINIGAGIKTRLG